MSCPARFESLCRNFRRRCVSFQRQWHELDCREYRLDEYGCLFPCGLRPGSLCGDGKRRRLSLHEQRHDLEFCEHGTVKHGCERDCRKRHESFCRNLGWRLSFQQQRDKLDRGRLDRPHRSFTYPVRNESLRGNRCRRFSLHRLRHKLGWVRCRGDLFTCPVSGHERHEFHSRD